MQKHVTRSEYPEAVPPMGTGIWRLQPVTPGGAGAQYINIYIYLLFENI